MWPFTRKKVDPLYIEQRVDLLVKMSTERDRLSHLRDYPRRLGACVEYHHDGSHVIEILVENRDGKAVINSEVLGHEIEHYLNDKLPEQIMHPHEK